MCAEGTSLPAPGTQPGPLLEELKQYALANIDKLDLGPDLLAREHFISTRQVHALFAAAGLGGTAAWIRARRMEGAASEIQSTTDKIASIASRWGYRNATSFSRAIRDEVGSRYPVGLRMSPNDHLPDGQGPSGFAEVAGIIEREGLGYIALADGNYESMDDNVPSRSGTMLEHGEPQAFRQEMPQVPLLLSSTFDPEHSARAIREGYADGVMLARQLLADPDYPRKVLDGRENEIVWCDQNNSCLRRLILNVPVRCQKNPEMGREAGATSARSSLRQEALIRLTGSQFLMGVADKLASARQR